MVAKQCPTPGTSSTEWVQVGPCEVWITWTADATSVYPVCDGDVTSVRVRNTGDVAWSVRVPRAGRTGGRLYTIAAGGDVTINGNQLRQLGYELHSQLGDLLLTLG